MPAPGLLPQELGFLDLVRGSFDIKHLPVDGFCDDAGCLPLRSAADVERAREVHLYQLCRKRAEQ